MYVERRLEAGPSEPEIIRMLKRYIAGEVFRWRSSGTRTGPGPRAPRLEEAYLTAVEEHVEQRLRQGGDVVLVSELEALVAAHRLRERLREQLLLALHPSGPSADALDVGVVLTGFICVLPLGGGTSVERRRGRRKRR